MRIIGTNGNDQLWDTAGDDLIRAGMGDDTVSITGVRDNVYLGEGNDQLYAYNGGRVLAYGDGGDDYIDLHEAGSGSAYGGEGDDFIIGAFFGDSLLDGGDDDDYIVGWYANDTLFGGGGSDGVVGGKGDDELWDDNATIYGHGNDWVNGGDGDDVLRGGRGADRLQGDEVTTRYVTRLPGADRFVFDDFDTLFGSARDVIVDFTPAEGDRIDLSLIDANWYVAGDQAFTFHGTNPTTPFNVTGAVWAYRAGADVIIQGSTDGDSFAEFEIGLQNFSGSLATGDFIS